MALGGTKIVDSAVLDRNRTWEKLSEQEKLLLAGDDRFGDDSGDGLPKIATAKDRLALIRRAKAELEAQAKGNGPGSRRLARRSGGDGRRQDTP